MKDLQVQLDTQRRKVDFDSFDITVKELVSMSDTGLIDIAPEYQRQFRWPAENQSRFVESVFLGIPVPSLFMAANKDGSWELIDGVQRLSSLIHFVGTLEQIEKFGLEEPLKLKGLGILTDFNNNTFHKLPTSIQIKFSLRPLKVTTLSDKSDLKVRFDLFERLNTGGIRLSDQEIRACVYRGNFNDFIKELAQNEDFNKVVNMKKTASTDGSKEELVLKFFAYLHNTEQFDHSVIDFLNEYMGEAAKRFDYRKNEQLFVDTFSQLAQELPNGIKRGTRKLTPVNLYEAIAVGAANAILEGHAILGSNIDEWINDAQLTKLTSGATNSRKRIKERVKFCYDRFVE